MHPKRTQPRQPSRTNLLHAALVALAAATASCGPTELHVDGLEGADAGDRRHVVLLAGERPVVECLPVDGACLLEGDIALVPGQYLELDEVEDAERGAEGSALLSFSGTWWKWPDGVVPYTIASNLSSSLRAKVQAAIAHWEERTSIRFVPRTTEGDWVTFRYSSAGYAWANIGRQGGQQFVNLVEQNRMGVIAHEIGHTLGFFHEHTRPDRDQHVTIHWGNIRGGFEGNFSTYASGVKVGAYDVDSIMHYPSYEFSRNGYATITRKDGTTYPANYTAVSAGDAAAVAQIYGDEEPVVDAGPIVVDSNNANNDASRGYVEVSGNWVPSTNVGGYYGTGYYYAPRASVADAASFWFYLPAPARKTIDARWTALHNRAPDAPFIIWDPDDRQLGKVLVDQRENGGTWRTLGTWDLPAGWSRVLVSRWTTSRDTYVIADAVRVR